MKNEEKELKANLKASEELRKRIDDYLSGLSEEDRAKVETNLFNALEPLQGLSEQLKDTISKAGEVIAPTLSTIVEKAQRYETCSSDAEYTGVDIDLILAQYHGVLSMDDLCRACGIKPAAMCVMLRSIPAVENRTFEYACAKEMNAAVDEDKGFFENEG